MVTPGQYPVIDSEESIYQAVEKIVNKFVEVDPSWKGYEALLVADKSGKIVGFLTLRCILKALRADGDGGRNKLWHSILNFRRGTAGFKVKDLMRSFKSNFVCPGDDLEKAVRIILEKNINSVPVMENDTIVGIIRSFDIFWLIEDLI